MTVELNVPPLQLGGSAVLRGTMAPSAWAWLRRQAARAWGHKVAAGAVLGLLLLAAVVHARGMAVSPGWADDEGTYVAQAWAVQHGHGLAHYTYWYDHPPVGWIQLAGWTWLTEAVNRGVPAVVAGRQAMLVALLASCVLLYALARRLGLRRGPTLAAVAIFALSPLAVGFQRMVFLDNIATPWLLAAFVLALSPERRISAAIGTGLCFAVAVLSKETTLLLLPALVWQAGRHADPRTRRVALSMLLVSGAMAIAAYPLFALLKGELLPGHGHVSLLSSAVWQLFGREGSGSLLDPASPVRGLVRSWLAVDPWLVWAGLAAVPLGLISRRLRPIGLAVVIQLATLARGGYVPQPFLINVLPFAAVLLAGVADAVWGRGAEGSVARSRLRRVVVAAAAASVLVAAAPSWGQGLRRELVPAGAVPMQEAGAWLEAHAARTDTLVVEDSLWVDLVRAGFDKKHVIWFYKLDFDPAVRLSGGWRDIDYLALGPVDARNLAAMPVLRSALDHASPVASFGDGSSAVTVYHVQQ